jgi:VCBS repeat-containing protein
MKKNAVNTAPTLKTKLVRRASGLMALEQRFMFDGAAVDTAHDQLADASHDQLADTTAVVSPQVITGDLLKIEATVSGLASASQLAQQQVRDYLVRATDEQLFEVFNGGKTAPDSNWTERLGSLREALENGSFAVNVVAMDSASQFTAMAAFTERGPNGEPIIFINTFWFGMLDAPDTSRVLVEELGHAFDAYLNPHADTAGDEGEVFADRVIDGSLSQTQSSALLTENDHGTVVVDGQTYEVEFASLNFTNAYHMVYDWDTQNNTEDTTERWASKEQNLHYFNTAGLGAVSISDGSNGTNFSGNDVSAVALTIGAQTFNGWISRPIKSNGIVRGFYFWTDSSFTTLALAQADGNQDGDSSVADNRGFVLVVDQTWFTQQINDTDFTKTFTSTSKDVINGYVVNNTMLTIASVGSSSDRVDSALNSVVSSNTAPGAVNDVASGTPSLTPSTGQGNAALEQGYNANTYTVITATIDGSGNVLANDTDSNLDSLSVTTITSKSTGASGTASTGGTQIVGKYGTLTMQADGDWTYAVNNSSATINALLSGNIQEDFTYTASDGKGGTSTATLTVQINGSNDAPVATNDYNVAKEHTSTNDTGYNATGNVLPNDTDVDTGDAKSIAGIVQLGNADASTIVSTTTDSIVRFDAGSGFNSNTVEGKTLYLLDGATYRAVHGTSGTLVTALNGGVTVYSGSVYNVKLSEDVYYYINGSGTQVNLTLAQLVGRNVGFKSSTTETTSTSSMKEATLTTTVSTGVYTVDLSNYTGSIAVGAALWYDNDSTANINYVNSLLTVQSIAYDPNGNPTQVTLNGRIPFSTGTAIEFRSSLSTGVTYSGQYGTLNLDANGSYTYTPYTDNSAINDGDIVTEVFDYTMQDTAGQTSAAKLYITVTGSGTNDPVLTADTATAYEAGVGRDGSNTVINGTTVYTGATATGDVLSNDKEKYSASSNQIGTGYVAQVGRTGSGIYTTIDTIGDGRTTTDSATVTGLYGSLLMDDHGSFTYTITNSNTTVNALQVGQTLTETFSYQVKNALSPTGYSWSILTITIQGTNDTPIAVSDTGSALTEDVTTSTSGNVTTNDTDVDTGDTKTVTKAGTSSANTSITAGTTSANGLAVDGTYGRLIIGADGTYTYTLGVTSAHNTAVQALNSASTPPTETFNYELTDSRGATSTTTLTFTVNGTNEPPVNQLNGASFSNTSTTTLTTAINTDLAFTGVNTLSVADADTDLASVTLTVEHGTLSFTGGTEASTTGSSVTITGTQASINAALAYLKYTPTTSYTGSDYLTIASKDATNRWDTDGIAINIPTAFTGPTVLESDLSTGSNSAGSGEVNNITLTAPTGQTFGANTQSGTDTYGTWTLTTAGVFTYTLTSAPAVSGANSTRTVNILTYDAFGNATTNTVTVTITDDAPVANANTKIVNEGASASGNVLTDGTVDVFGADGAKTTSPTGGVVGARASGGDTTTAVTSGTGSSISGTYGSLTLNADGSYTYTATASISATVTDTFVYTIEDADGDRSTTTLTITVNDASTPTIAVTGYGPVNEGSTYATFTVQPGNSSSSDLINLSVSNGSTSLSTPALEYSTDGTNWTVYDNTHKPNGGGVFYVRVNITSEADTTYEGSESFSLVAAYAANSSITDSASTSIIDDGTGTNYTGNVSGGSPVTNTTSLNDDRALSVNSITVNEGGGYAVFTVSANAGQTMNLALSDGTTNPTATSGTDYTNALEYWDGSNWVSYTAGFTVPGASNAAVLLYVRVAITNDSTFENAEDFKLTATYTSGASRSAVGVATIVDDGTGTKYDGTLTNGSPTTDLTNLNDDRSGLITVTGGNYNENSPRAVFTVNANSGQVLTLDVQNAAQSGKAPTGDNEGKPNDSLDTAPIYYSLDGGATWQLYTGPITAGNVPVLVAVDITNERDDVYEGEEQLKLVVTSGGQSTSGYASIFDDGTGLIKQPDGSTDNTTPKDDDRPKPALAPKPPEAPAPKAPAPEAPQPDPVKPPTQVFSSEVQPLAPRLVPVEAPVPLGDVLTSSSGFRVAVNETASPGLALNRGITDQFVEGNGSSSKISMPYDAFIHSNKDAVIKLDAKLADNSPLPNWVRFDPATGSFEVNPPKDFKGKLDLKVVAMDDDGREATALFQLFVGDKPADQKPQSRNSLTEKLRLAGQRPITLIKVGDVTRPSAAPEVAKRVATVQRATVG